MSHRVLCALFLIAVVLAGAPASAQSEEYWIPLWNGRDLDDWIVKIRGYETGVNFNETFRVEDGVMKVVYEGYGDFANRFGHIFYKDPYSHYRLRVEYRFVGEQAANGPDWARRNSGAMLHSPHPDTMPAGQDFPISIEVQFLGGLGDGNARSTANLCTPGTNVVYRGEFTETHCMNSSSPTLDGEQWVEVEVLVLGDERVVHSVNGERVMEYGDLTYGGGEVSGHRPEMKPDGEPIAGGYISLQSESHPVEFRRVELLNLRGCLDPDARNFRSYFVSNDADSCEFD